MTNSLVALSSAAVLTVYGAGFMRTKAAADRFNVESDERRPGPGATSGRGALPVAAPQHDTASAQTAVTLSPTAPQPVPGAVPAAATATASAKTPTSDAAAATRSAAKATTKTETVASDAPTAASPAAATDTTATQPAAASATTPAPAAAPVAGPEPAPAPQGQWKDGTYTGWGTSRHGDIQAFVTIESGKIAQAGIAQCLTRYSCSWIAHLPPQVVSRQSPEVDWVSGATQSVNAFYYAIVEALAKAK